FTDPLLRVDAPFRQERKLLVHPNVTSPQITQLTVELEYADPANAYERRFLITLDAPFASKTFAWPILDPNRQAVRYRVTAHEPGFLREGAWIETADPSIVVGSAGSRVAKVQVRLIGATLVEAGLDAVQLKIELLVDGAPRGEGQSFLLEGNQTSQEVKLELPPGTPLRYRYQTIAFKSDGRVVESEWKDVTNPLLVITTRTL
ncbi:MAG: hypothetical protein HY660_08735, partial [Armatimonadetes bacterium]|nr:hypothetical protein [Armatimonadota bacterium]